MISIMYTITLDGPLLATMLGGDPNSGVSASYIPGSMIRGMLIGRYGPHDELATVDRDLFFSGQVCYLHAYPADVNRSEQQRSLPVPASWRKAKVSAYKQGAIEDWALLENVDRDSQLEDPTPVSGDFVWFDEEGAVIRSPERQIAIHTQRSRGPGRATLNEGAVYRYEALAEGEQFSGVILCEDQSLAQRVKDLLVEGIAYLGGAQTAGYGRVQISNVHPEKIDDDSADELWKEYEGKPEDIVTTENVVITLLSDAILRDDHGSIHTNLLATLDFPLQLLSAFKQISTIGGFNRKWGLPLPQTQVLGAGSVFVCRATAAIMKEQIEELLMHGVGERRAEGFGRIAVNWQVYENLIQYSPSLHNVRLAKQDLSEDAGDPSRQLAQRMVNRRQRQLLDQSLLKAVRSLEIELAPPNSQLSGIRIIARHALQEGNLDRISSLFKGKLEGGMDNPNAMKQRARTKFERARIDNGKRLNDWIIQLADNPQTVWNTLGLPSNVLGPVKPQQDLAASYVVRLIDAVLGQEVTKRRGQDVKDKEATNGSA